MDTPEEACWGLLSNTCCCYCCQSHCVPKDQSPSLLLTLLDFSFRSCGETSGTLKILAVSPINEEPFVAMLLPQPILAHCPLTGQPYWEGQKEDILWNTAGTRAHALTHTLSPTLISESQTQAGREKNGQGISQSGNQLNCRLPQAHVIQGVSP